jgi:hypothetical protein
MPNRLGLSPNCLGLRPNRLGPSHADVRSSWEISLAVK